jgi:hypothetical protein
MIPRSSRRSRSLGGGVQMTWIIRLRSWLRTILHRSRMERDMEAELLFAIPSYLTARHLIRGGWRATGR